MISWRAVRSTVQTFYHDERGAVLVYVTMSMLVLMGFLAIVLDLGYLAIRQSQAQTAADAAALGALEQLYLNASESTATSVAGVAVQKSDFPSTDLTMGYLNSSGSSTTSSTSVVTVTSTISDTYATLLAGIFGATTASVEASGTASFAKTTQYVVYSLESSGSSAFLVQGSGNVNISGGGIAVKSSSTNAAYLTGSGSVSATAIGVVGTAGKSNPSPSYSPTPTSIFSVIDPYVKLAMPVAGQSAAVTPNSAKHVCDNCSYTLPVGAYQSLDVHNSQTVTLNAGTYIFTGAVIVEGNTTLIATSGTTLYFTCGTTTTAACSSGGSGGSLTVQNSGVFSIVAPSSGTYQGMAIMYDRNNGAALSIVGGSSSTMSGTLYAPSAAVTIDNGGVSQTINSRIVAKTVTLTGSGTLTDAFDQNQNAIPTGYPILG